MLQVIRFLLHTIIDFMRMLFTIDVGNNMSLGLLMCIVFIFLPMMLRIIAFLKRDAMEELNDRYDESRPREIFSSWEDNSYNPKTNSVKTIFHQREGIHWRSRYRSGRPSIKRRVLK